MYNEVIPGSYLCKLKQGVAYYLVAKGVYDATAKMNNSYFIKVNLTHLLSKSMYQNDFGKIELLNWEDMPQNYQLDAIAINEDIRRKYHEQFYGTQDKQVSNNLRGLLFSAVDKATGELRHFKFKTGINSTHGPIYNLEETPLSFAAKEASAQAHAANVGGSYHINHNGERTYTMIREATSEQTNNNSNNNTNNSSMNLLGNIPGLNLSFGPLEKGRIAVSLNGDLAFRDKNGQYVTIQEEGSQKTRVEVGDLKVDIEFYKVPTQELELGDVVLLDGELLLVNEKKNGDIQFVNPVSGAKTTKLQRSNILGMYFYTKVVSLFNLAGGEAKGIGLNGLDPMTLMLLSGQGGSFGGGDLSQLLVMSQLTKGGNDINPLMLMALSNNHGASGGGDLMQSIFMMQALGGGKGLTGLFGGKNTKKVAPKPVVRKKTPAKKAPAKVAKA